ncbi:MULTISPECIES: ubiquinol oxidase subunit II [unclassified Methylobacterium]|jgi:cytochrome o ubiquinol oxidase subunit II|uniref:ubiquinol oxidase subunit II n=1 Tax=unclassified Methylobacterium TaxID=2615210 RepID=UPI001352415F|nr:ubiquinol oxidase subunit II [Methylobacterium sp. 2A]MWV25352.1 ubiquinol oxidase subunit II [Methylobacterium sp. 2A]
MQIRSVPPLRLLLVAAAPALLGGCQQHNLLDAKGPVGAAEANILIIATIIMLAIIVPTMIATVIFALWYRESNPKALYRPDWAFSGRIELVVWSVPFLTITFLGGIAWIGAHRLDPAVPLESDRKPLQVQVVSLDWKWLFLYPDQGVASVNELVVPAATPVTFKLTSSSVWNSFFVPKLGSMIYTMRGMVTTLNLMADQAGELHGLSTHFSGDGFADMHFPVRAVSDSDFAAWVNGAKGSGAALDKAAYAELTKQSIADPPRSFGSVEPGLFDGIVAQTVPPGPGPAAGGVENVRPKGGA